MGSVLGFGGYRVASGAITPGTLIAIIFYMTQITEPIEKLSGIFTGYKKSVGASKRLYEIMNEKEEELNSGDNVIENSSIHFDNVFSVMTNRHLFLKEYLFLYPK
ncbi:hypothetical protein [Staphylococcus warneri]|uniref:hypothetical protein n=1 Tax=Staphylococcus warneri TaxID=1292 RepID=UPI00345DFC4F